MKLIMLFVSLLLTLTLHAQRNEKKCHAVLLSAEDGTVVNAAVISYWPGNVHTISDNKGSFEINCAADSLRITHVNFVPLSISLKNKNGLAGAIRLQPLVKQLDEVQVNTGYQSLPKERATGSFEKINNQLFNQQVSTNVMERLEWIANGMYTDRKTNQLSTNYTIRGLSTIKGPRAPLVIVDNFPYEGDLNNINPNDVESITILKDAAASSIWGTRAGNGVIVITTKKARFSQPLRVEVNSNISIAEKPGLFYYNNIGPSDFIDVEQFLYSKGYFNSMITSSSRPVLSPVVELLIKKANGTLTAADADAKINALRSHDLRDDFDKYMYQPAVNKQYAVNLRGGSNNIAYLFSAGYDNNTGSLNDKYNRSSFRSENSFRISSKLQLTTSITYSQSNSKDGRIGYGTISTANGRPPMYTRLTDDAGNPVAVIKQYRQPYLDTAGGGKLLNWNYYPIDEHNHLSNTNRIQSLIGDLSINYKIIKGLSADIKYQYQNQNSNTTTLYDQESFSARNMINSYSQLNRATGVVTYKVPKGGILNNSNSQLTSHNIRGQLNLSRLWTKHEITAIAGTEIRETNTTGNSGTTYGYNSDILTFSSVDYANTYPNYVTGSSSFIPSGISFNDKLNRSVSFYGNAAYTFNSKYSFTISGRRDASNLFGVHTNDKWTPLWSAGTGWDISKEKFYHFKPVPYLKFRATYGFSGNADPGNAAVSVISYQANSTYTLAPTARIDQFGNPDLRWEKVGMLNIGVDFNAFAGRLQGSVEYYHKKAKDLFGSAAVDYTAVATYRLERNVATMKANGWDISLNSVNLKGAVGWTSNLNFSINKDEVVDYYLTNKQALNYVGGGIAISALQGRPVYAVYSYRWAGLDPVNGDPRGYINGAVSKDYNSFTGTNYLVDSLVYNGPAFPTKFGSFGNTITWKNFSLTARLAYKFGYYFMRSSINYTNLFGSRQGNGDYSLRWQQTGDELNTNVPSMVYPAVARRDQFYGGSEVLVEKGDHIRLQYVTLSYDLKNLKYKWLPFSTFNFYVNANNLGIIWRANNHGIDPDYRDNSILPPKNIAVGLKAGF